MTVLKNHTTCPPGEFFVKVRIVGPAIVEVHGVCTQPDCYQFGPSPDIRGVANQLYDFLVGNRISGYDKVRCLQIIDTYTCVRLGNGHKWCKDSDKVYADSSRSARALTGRGGCCGAKL